SPVAGGWEKDGSLYGGRRRLEPTVILDQRQRHYPIERYPCLRVYRSPHAASQQQGIDEARHNGASVIEDERQRREEQREACDAQEPPEVLPVVIEEQRERDQQDPRVEGAYDGEDGRDGRFVLV